MSESELDLERRAHAEVLALVSHDIRAPLGVVLGAVSELVNPSLGPLSDEQRQLVQLVRRSGEKLSRLAGNVLFLNRVAVDRVSLQPQRIDAGQLVRRAIESFEKAGELGRLRVARDVPAERVDLDVYFERATQAIVNVVANALRFAREEVRVGLAVDGAVARITVDDDGPGVPADQLPLLFDAHARLRAADAGGPTVRGLGLVVAKGILDAHGAAVRAETRVDDTGRAVGFHVELAFSRAL